MSTNYPPQRWPKVSCDEKMTGFFNGVSTFCGRPQGHDGACWPVPTSEDLPPTGGEARG